MLEDIAPDLFDLIDTRLADATPEMVIADIARVVSVGNGVARVVGFSDLGANELLRFPGGVFGLATSLNRDSVGVVLLGKSEAVRVGDSVSRTRRVADVPVGEALLGRVVDPLGRALDEAGPIRASESLRIERPAPEIMDRDPVDQPLQTGIKAVDAAVPIGRGQRELIVGDRQTGKTAIAVDTILNQQEGDVVAVYCAIGQRASAVARVIEKLRRGGALERTIVLVASGEDAPGLRYIAPYAATSMAEHFMEQGRDVLIVYDDLTRHARAYRELSLLLRRPPGREAYPGDIFYIHSRLLERATHLRDEHGGGSLTALPIIETQAQNISAFIPTNLISITDGQIYLSPKLFEMGQLPAIDIGESVSRVGGKVQLPAFRAVAGDLRLFYSQFEELESFARFGTQMDDDTRAKLERGRRVRAILRQNEQDHMDVAPQIAVLLAATEGCLDAISVDLVPEAEKSIRTRLADGNDALREALLSGDRLNDEDRTALLDLIDDALGDIGDEDGHA